MTMSWCSDCGAEHWLAAARCVECGGQLSETYVAPVVVSEPSHGVSGIFLGGLDDAERWHVELELSTAGIPYQLDGGVLSVGDVHEPAALGIVHAVPRRNVDDAGSAARAEPDVRFEVQSQPRPCRLRRRLVAAFIDVVIVTIPVAIVVLLMSTELLAVDGDTPARDLWVLSNIGTVLQYGYLTVFTATTGATIGKRVADVRVVANDGTPVGWKVAVKRYVVLLVMMSAGAIADLLGETAGASWFIAMLAPIVVYAPVAWSPSRTALHDRVSDTMVIRVGGGERSGWGVR